MSRMGPGLFTISCLVRPGKNPQEAEAAISEEIAALHASPVSPKELQRAQVAARRAAISSRTSALSRAMQLADDAVMYNDPNRINTTLEKRMAVTAVDIQNAAKTYLRTANRVVIHTVPAARPAGPSKGEAKKGN